MVNIVFKTFFLNCWYLSLILRTDNYRLLVDHNDVWMSSHVENTSKGMLGKAFCYLPRPLCVCLHMSMLTGEATQPHKNPLQDIFCIFLGQWFHKFPIILDHGFQKCSADHSLLTKGFNPTLVALLMYVDADWGSYTTTQKSSSWFDIQFKFLHLPWSITNCMEIEETNLCGTIFY